MENTIKTKTLTPDVKQRITDILLAISWREIARTYFGKSSSWIYHKLDGINGNGEPDEFTIEESTQLKRALYDLSDRIRKAADTL